MAFLVLVGAILLLSVREWIFLLARKKAAELRETPPLGCQITLWRRQDRCTLLSLLALAFALAKELSGEAHVERECQQMQACNCVETNQQNKTSDRATAYLKVTEETI